LADPAAIVEGVPALGDLLDPGSEPAHELAVIVGIAGREIKAAVGRDRTDRAGGDTELALEAWVIVDRLVVSGRLGVQQHGSQQDEAAEPGMDDVAMDAHPAQA